MNFDEKVAQNKEILKGTKLERIFCEFSETLLFHARNYGLVGEIELENSNEFSSGISKFQKVSLEFSKRNSIFREKGIEFSANDSLK